LFRFFSAAAICGRTGTKLPCPREPALDFLEHRFIDIDSLVGFRVIGFLNSPGLGANRPRHQSRYWTSVTKNHNGLASLDEIHAFTQSLLHIRNWNFHDHIFDHFWRGSQCSEGTLQTYGFKTASDYFALRRISSKTFNKKSGLRRSYGQCRRLRSASVHRWLRYLR